MAVHPSFTLAGYAQVVESVVCGAPISLKDGDKKHLGGEVNINVRELAELKPDTILHIDGTSIPIPERSGNTSHSITVKLPDIAVIWTAKGRVGSHEERPGLEAVRQGRRLTGSALSIVRRTKDSACQAPRLSV